MFGWLFIAGLIAANDPPPSTADRCENPSRDWATTAVTRLGGDVVKNTMRLEDGRLVWNGVAIPERTARQYLELVNEMRPRPLIVLAYDPETPCRSVQRTRALIDDVLQCRPGLCLEVTSSRD